MDAIDRAKGYGWRFAHRGNTPEETLLSIDPDNQVNPDEREAFTGAFWDERIVMNCLAIRIQAYDLPLSIEQRKQIANDLQAVVDFLKQLKEQQGDNANGK